MIGKVKSKQKNLMRWDSEKIFSKLESSIDHSFTCRLREHLYTAAVQNNSDCNVKLSWNLALVWVFGVKEKERIQ